MDCKDALDMICNLESEENEKGALSLCTAFLKRQLLQGDVYCAWYDLKFDLCLVWPNACLVSVAGMFCCTRIFCEIHHLFMMCSVPNRILHQCLFFCLPTLTLEVKSNMTVIYRSSAY